MEVATIVEKVSAADYQATERESDTKHEYLDGSIIPMSGASIPHTIVCYL